MRRFAMVLLATLAACGDDEGVPLDGDVEVTYGGEAPIPMTVGAAIADHQAGADDPAKALVVFGTRGVSCETTLDEQLARGTYVQFEIDRVVGAQSPVVGVIRIESGGAHFNGTAGEVELTVLDDDGVEGRVTMTTEDADVGVIAVAGSFRVARCF